jgi:hypothetical protein
VTPAEQIAHLRSVYRNDGFARDAVYILAVCDLAEKWLAYEAEEANAAAEGWGGQDITPEDHVRPR